MTLPKHQQIAGILDSVIKFSENAGVLLVDIANFSLLNVGLGFDKCDLLIVEVEKMLSRLVDVGDVVHYYYADKFIVIIEHTATKEIIAHSNYIKQSFSSSPVKLNSLEIPIDVLISHCCVTDVPPSGATILQTLEWSMSLIKQNPHNADVAPEVHSLSADEAVRNVGRHSLIRDAIKNGEMHNYYQPIFNMRSNSIVGFESLARWINPTIGVMPPASFLPFIEQNNQMEQLTKTVLNNILRDFSESDIQYMRSQCPDFYISINVPPAVLIRRDFRDVLIGIAKQNPVYSGLLAVEITEQSLDTPLSIISDCCDHFKSNGVRVLIDDFGTGYSSLNRIANLPINAIKVDRSFLMDTDNKDINASIIRFALDIAAKRGLQVVFEGVANKEALDFALSLGAISGQGFHFSEPISAADLITKFYADIPI